ncbi:MAG: amino acid ABC transporter ATP-binding protein [Chloroflexi bacterium]|nr:amino acid ABC transporter ATP-binding protein [Chloroflexota bacterium]
MSEAIIKVRGLHKYFGPLHVIKGVDLDVQPREVVVIIGPSGGGKSTFLRCLNFLEEPSAGVIEIDELKINAGESLRHQRKRIRELRQKVGMVFQQFNLFPHMTVLQNIIEAPITVKKMPRAEAIEKAEELLAWVGLSEKRDEYPSRLSGGQQQRVAIARALCMEPKIMLFDEPTSALDPELINEVVDVMERLANDGMTMVVVTHELHFARDVADRVILMADGAWAEIAPPDEFFTNPKELRTRQFLAHIL